MVTSAVSGGYHVGRATWWCALWAAIGTLILTGLFIGVVKTAIDELDRARLDAGYDLLSADEGS